jgi:cobalt-zinc-cadmium efflux system membrane fusion protein
MNRSWPLGIAFVLACGKAPVATPDIPRAPERAGAARTVSVEAPLLASGRVVLGDVVRRPPATELRVTGEVRANESGSAEAGTLVAGRVGSLVANEGARVQRGQVLAWVEAPDASRAAADVLRARARAEVAAKRLARELTLQEQAATSAGAVEDARAADAVARADLAAARTLLVTFGAAEPSGDAKGEALSVRVPVRAPIAGIIVQRHAVLGAAVAPDTTLFHIVAGGRVFVAANVPETTPLPPEGGAATIVGRGDETLRCNAAVGGNLRVIDDATRTVAVRVQPDATCAWLAPGRYVDVLFARAADAKPELVLPAEAVVDVDGVPTAFVSTGKEGELVARTVRVRATAGPDVIIESGLVEGERVATRGALLLKGELSRAALEGQ